MMSSKQEISSAGFQPDSLAHSSQNGQHQCERAVQLYFLESEERWWTAFLTGLNVQLIYVR